MEDTKTLNQTIKKQTKEIDLLKKQTDEMKNNYIAARDTMNGNSNSSVIEEDDLDIPF